MPSNKLKVALRQKRLGTTALRWGLSDHLPVRISAPPVISPSSDYGQTSFTVNRRGGGGRRRGGGGGGGVFAEGLHNDKSTVDQLAMMVLASVSEVARRRQRETVEPSHRGRSHSKTRQQLNREPFIISVDWSSKWRPENYFHVIQFVHYMDLCCISSRLLLRSAPDSRTAKRSSFKARVECVGLNHGEQSQRQWKPILNRGPTTENVLVWRVEVRARGIKSTPPVP